MVQKTRKRGREQLNLEVTQDHLDRAKQARSHSGRCMIAQVITEVYGPKASPIVDTDFIRFTDPDTGDRLFYKTPPAAQAALLLFDAGLNPEFPLHIRGRVTYVRTARRYKEAKLNDVRKWAREQDEFQGSITDRGAIPDEVINAYLAVHPEVDRVHTQHRSAVSIGAASNPKVTINQRDQPAQGNLSNGKNIPASRRRTYGSRTLTRALIEAGWVPPEEPKA